VKTDDRSPICDDEEQQTVFNLKTDNNIIQEKVEYIIFQGFKNFIFKFLTTDGKRVMTRAIHGQ